MSARLDWIVVGPHGVYALLDAGLASRDEVAAFTADAERRGHEVDLVDVEEAVRRHREFLYGPDWMHGWWEHPTDLPSFLPSPAQLDLFGARP